MREKECEGKGSSRDGVIDWVALKMMDASFVAQLFVSSLSFVKSNDAVPVGAGRGGRVWPGREGADGAEIISSLIVGGRQTERGKGKSREIKVSEMLLRERKSNVTFVGE